MYNTPAAAAVVTLPFTGLNVLWIALVAFALIAVGLAVLRLVPKSEA